MHVAVVANGELPVGYESSVRAVFSAADLVIAADGGLRHCARLGRWPEMLVGDLDSAESDLVDQARDIGVDIRLHPQDKDATDLELALAVAVTAGATSITVVTAFGGRLDHELATVALLASVQWTPVTVAATDGRRALSIVRQSLDLHLAVGQTVSLIPWGGEVTGVTTTGLRWPLTNETLPLGTTRGVSNVAAHERQSVRVNDGVLLAVTDQMQEVS